MFCQEELLLKVCRLERSPAVCMHSGPALRRLVAQQHRLMLGLWERGLVRSRRAPPGSPSMMGADRAGSSGGTTGGRIKYQRGALPALPPVSPDGKPGRKPAVGVKEEPGVQGPQGAGVQGAGVGTGPEDECATCHAILHVGAVECDCCPGRLVCLHHADTLCECPMGRRRLVYRYSVVELLEVRGRVGLFGCTAS